MVSVLSERPAEALSPFVSLRVKAVIAETVDASSIAFEVPEELSGSFRYTPGQFLTLKVDVGGESLLRCYSLSSMAMFDRDPKVTVKRVKDGRVSNWLLDNLRAGDVMTVMPPKGVFALKEGSGPVVMFAAGSGITPIISMVKQLLGTTDRVVDLVYANRDEQSVIFADELDRLRFQYGDRFGVTHRFDSEMGIMSVGEVRSYMSADADYYMCGPGPFMDIVKAGLKAAGVADAHVHSESFDVQDEEPAGVAAALTESGDEAATVTVRYHGADHVISVPHGETVHAAAGRQGLKLPFSCRAGYCGLCLAKVASGAVHIKDNLGAITDAQQAEGWTLACQALVDSPEATIIYE